MKIQIQDVSPDHYEKALIALFKRQLTPDFDERRFDWLYRKNPWGKAQTWAAFDIEKKIIVGAAAAFPRKFRFRGAKKLGWVLGDFCLAVEYRSMGPALQLQRACLQALQAPFEFCYDFPSQAMMAIYKRMGVQQAGALIRWAKPLQLDSKLEPIVRSRRVAQLIGRPLKSILSARGWKGVKDSCQVELLHGRCGEEFTALDQSLRKERGVSVERTSEYLNWRYLDCPGLAHEILVARRNSSLVGYVVVRNEPGGGRIVDLASQEEAGIIVRLIAEAVNRMMLRGAKTANLIAGEGHPWSTLFERAGFRRRENSPIVFIACEGTNIKPADFCAGSYLMEGDRDS
jgi:hypothetical protein